MQRDGYSIILSASDSAASLPALDMAPESSDVQMTGLGVSQTSRDGADNSASRSAKKDTAAQTYVCLEFEGAVG